MPVLPALEKLREENPEFTVSLGYSVVRSTGIPQTEIYASSDHGCETTGGRIEDDDGPVNIWGRNDFKIKISVQVAS